MSAEGDATAPHEVVIVRRRGGEGDDGHHGGAWKIAFADLMTAMMAFFLVMWLLNVSDKEKIQQIATYFNPLKLNSKRPTVKGIQEEQETPKAAPSENAADDEAKLSAVDETKKKKGGAASGGDGERPEGSAQQSEEELFNDPYGVLARLAATGESQSAQSNASTNVLPSGGGDSYSNPLDPFAGQASPPPKSVQSEHEQLTLADPGTHPLPPGLEKPLEVRPEDSAGEASAHKDGPAGAAGVDQSVKTLSDALSKALDGLASDKKPNIEVKRVDEGVLISLTDDFRFGMFDSASAKPRPELVVVMEKVANVVASYDGRILVRGHTDARPFRTERNNNWRLSMERAQMAYYMLVRGGVNEKRFESIEGHADRALKVPSDPNAADNRRIEILVRPKP